jgi:hypothetical protein
MLERNGKSNVNKIAMEMNLSGSNNQYALKQGLNPSISLGLGIREEKPISTPNI